MTEVVYIMACNYSYCEPKLPLSLTTHQLVSTMQIKQNCHRAERLCLEGRQLGCAQQVIECCFEENLKGGADESLGHGSSYLSIRACRSQPLLESVASTTNVALR